MLNKLFVRAFFLTGQYCISSNNKFCSTHTLNQLYWDYYSLCHLMSMKKACSQLVSLMNFVVPPTHAYNHTYTQAALYAQANKIDGNLPRMRFFYHSFVCIFFGKKKEKKKTVIITFILRMCQLYVCECVDGYTNTPAHVHSNVIDNSS